VASYTYGEGCRTLRGQSQQGAHLHMSEAETAEPADGSAAAAATPAGPGAPGAPANRRRKLIMIGAAATVALLAIAGGGYALLAPAGHKQAPTAAEAMKDAVFVEVPPIVVNMKDAEGRSTFLKVKVLLAVDNEKVAERAKVLMPTITDPFLSFLRELRPEDLAGSQAVFRIKEEMLVRSSQALAPDKIHDVLIQELVQQ
jgi:flagellar protein FliL